MRSTEAPLFPLRVSLVKQGAGTVAPSITTQQWSFVRFEAATAKLACNWVCNPPYALFLSHLM
ncbi:hypothetical protein PSCICP_35690 [Pseudomonas cichorii]|uniref:Uncharacterized protein n=1 Tax=Pseudomonas cichorii TaxID=36746 RepID=A0ABQ1DRY9_PSECI|nr:hypothetical protein PSCICP_35690 [Pseudomonas cichorii]